MDCRHKIKDNDWENYYKEKEEGYIDENISYKIFDYKSIVLHNTDIIFKNNIESILSEYRGGKKNYYQYFIDSVMNNYDNSYYIYLLKKDKIIGMTRAGVRKKKVEISNVFLLEQNRGKGYAFNMLNKFLIFLKKQDDVIKVGLSVEKDNKNAFNLYKKLNFIIECEKVEELYENNKIVKYKMIYMYLK